MMMVFRCASFPGVMLMLMMMMAFRRRRHRRRLFVERERGGESEKQADSRGDSDESPILVVGIPAG